MYVHKRLHRIIPSRSPICSINSDRVESRCISSVRALLSSEVAVPHEAGEGQLMTKRHGASSSVCVKSRTQGLDNRSSSNLCHSVEEQTRIRFHEYVLFRFDLLSSAILNTTLLGHNLWGSTKQWALVFGSICFGAVAARHRWHR